MMMPAMPVQQQPQQQQPVSPSPLDRWAVKEYGLPASQIAMLAQAQAGDPAAAAQIMAALTEAGLSFDPQAALQAMQTHIVDIAERRRQSYGGRNERMLEELDLYWLTRPVLTEEEEAKNVMRTVSPLPKLVVDRIAAMQASADWVIEMPASSAVSNGPAQATENLVYWWWRQQSTRHAAANGSSLERDIPLSGALNGWQCALIMPTPAGKSQNEQVHFELVDGATVYPLFGPSGPVYVLRQFAIAAAEAIDLYPEAQNMLSNLDDDDVVTVIAYYDAIYHAILLSSPLGGGRNRITGASVPDSAFVKPPAPHFCKDLDGNPEIPWIIGLPNGTGRAQNAVSWLDASGGTARTSQGASGASTEGASSRTMGVGYLYSLADIYSESNDFYSLVLTAIAKDIKPPKVVHVQPGQDPVIIDTSPDATNYILYQRNALDFIKTQLNPQLVQVYGQYLQDGLNKAGLPSVAWGDSGSITSGIGVTQLGRSTVESVLPYVTGTQLFMREVSRRVLHCHVTAQEEFGLPPVSIVAPAGQRTGTPLSFNGGASGGVPSGGRLTSGVTVSAAQIREAGDAIEVVYKNLTASDVAQAIQAETLAMQGRLHSRDTAMRATGIQDVEAEKIKIEYDTLNQDPVVQSILGPLVIRYPELTDQQRIVIAWMIQQQQIAMMQAQQMAQGFASGGGTGGGASGASPAPAQAQAQQPGAGLPSQTVSPPAQPAGLFGQASAGEGGMAPAQNPMNGGANGTGMDTFSALIQMLSGGTPPRMQ